MGKYVDGKENIKLEDLSEYCSGVVVNGREWQRKLAEMLSSYLPLTEIMANPVDYPKALLKEVVNLMQRLKTLFWKMQMMIFSQKIRMTGKRSFMSVTGLTRRIRSTL